MAQPMKGCLCKCEGLGFDYNKTGLGAMSITLALGWGSIGGKEGKFITLALGEGVVKKVCP